ELKRRGVIGINERNVRYVNANNPRRLVRLVDDKVETKRLAQQAGIPTPDLIGSIANARDMRELDTLTYREDGFVIKPAQGAQGNGIMVVTGQLKGGFRLANGRRITKDEIKFHINNVLSGMYSLGGQPDVAMLEYRVKFDPVFETVSFKGVPDIRIVTFKGIPVMAMLRLPTAESDGKANLHKGGVGVGLDIATGAARSAMQHDSSIDAHPDTAAPLRDIQVPDWDDILLMAARAYDVAGLGYLGVDIVLDEQRGPLLLELNARPGLSIQIANQLGVKDRLNAATHAADEKARDAPARVALAKSLYTDADSADIADEAAVKQAS
ncbi:MAG: alpha-L-glutamate ligase-like protein, partial [Pseudomonadota bacterium]